MECNIMRRQDFAGPIAAGLLALAVMAAPAYGRGGGGGGGGGGGASAFSGGGGGGGGHGGGAANAGGGGGGGKYGGGGNTFGGNSAKYGGDTAGRGSSRNARVNRNGSNWQHHDHRRYGPVYGGWGFWPFAYDYGWGYYEQPVCYDRRVRVRHHWEWRRYCT
jgi:hypothetical protein